MTDLLSQGPGFIAGLLLACGWLGHVAYEAGVRRDSPARRVPTAERVFAQLVFALAFVTWIGIALAQAERFRGSILLGTIVATGLVVRLAGQASRRGRRPSRGVGLDSSVPVVALLAAIAAYLYVPPFETHVAARDPAVYQLAGIHLAEEGSWIVHDQAVASLGPEMKEYLFPAAARGPDYDWTRFVGFALEEVDGGRVVPQFLPGYPVWLAIGYLGGGLQGALHVTPLLAWIGLVALYFLGRRLFHPAVGAAAAVLLAGSFVNAWFARYGAAEMLAQPLMLAGLYALVWQRRHRDPFFALLAASCFGLLWLTEAQLALLAGPLFVLLTIDLVRGEVDGSTWRWFWLPLGFLGLHAGAQALYWSWPYISDLLRVVYGLPPASRTLGIPGVSVAPLAGVAIGAALFVLLMHAWTRRWSASRHDRFRELLSGGGRRGTFFRRAASILLLELAVWAYWIRPLRHKNWEVRTFFELGQAVSGLGLALAVFGALLLLNDRMTRRGIGPVLGIMLPLSLLTLWKPKIVPELLWAYRRDLPVVLPFTLMLLAYGCWRLWESGPAWALWLRRRRSAGAAAPFWLRPATAALALSAVVWVSGYSAAMALRYGDHRESAGSLDFVHGLAAVIDPDAVVLFEPASSLGLRRFEGPLALIEKRRVLRLNGMHVWGDLLLEFVRASEQRGRSVYFVTSGLFGFDYRGWFPAADPISRFPFAIQRLESVEARLPTEVVEDALDVVVYRLRPRSAGGLLSAGIDIGSWDDLYTTGFHAAEVQLHGEPKTFRWTRESSGLWLPGLPDGVTRIVVECGIGTDRPETEGPATLELSLDGIPLGRVEVERGWGEYAFNVPDSWVPPAGTPPRLSLGTPVWSPADHGNPTDTRRLGIKIDAVRWEGAP